MLRIALAFLVTVVSFQASADLVLTMGGDVNFNKNRQRPELDGTFAYGKKHSFESLTSGLRHLINGDLNFANIETVVSDRMDLMPQDKQFVFMSHPNSIRHLANIGFNLFALSNNHAYDAGHRGLDETWRNMAMIKRDRPEIEYQGGGSNRHEAARPVVFRKNGYTIAFASIGILDTRFRASESRPGLLNIRDESDYGLILASLREVQADLKIISIHFGTEGKTSLDAGQRARFNRAIQEADVDIVIGHHPHVVRPVEMVNGKLIIYSLGNYLMLGAANMGGRAPLQDYGLFARVYFGWDSASRRLKAQAMEAVPLTEMHARPRPMEPQVAVKRIQLLNDLGKRELGSQAVYFNPRSDGSGLACAAAGTNWTERAARLCGQSAVQVPLR